MIHWKTLTAAAAMAIGMFAGVASAAPVQTFCPPGGPTAGRDFTVTIEGPTAAGCVLYGNGPSGPGTDPAILTAVSPATLLDKTDSVGASGVVLTAPSGDSTNLFGTWSISVPTGFVLSNVYLLFQTGVAQLNPDWAVFSIPNGILAGSWTVERNGLSHANVYGTLTPATVPVPAAGLMLLGALGGLVALRRRRKAA
jgi:hypothetical protein